MSWTDTFEKKIECRKRLGRPAMTNFPSFFRVENKVKSRQTVVFIIENLNQRSSPTSTFTRSESILYCGGPKSSYYIMHTPLYLAKKI